MKIFEQDKRQVVDLILVSLSIKHAASIFIVARGRKMVDNNGRVIGQTLALGAQVQAKLQIAMPLRASSSQTSIHAQFPQARSTE